MKRLLVSAAIALCIASNGIRADQRTPATLDIYFLDMVGGGSTLIVTPLRESVLIDTGSLEPKHRDADRIYQACRHAGLEHIDYLLTLEGRTSPFGYAAYSVSRLKEPLSIMKDRLQELKGVGKMTEGIILEILETGSSSYYEKLSAG